MRINRNLCLSFIFILFAGFWSCTPALDHRVVEGEVIRLDSINAPVKDSAVDAAIAPYREQLEAEMTEVLAYSEQAMQKDSPEGLLNNFVADLVLDKARELYSPEDGKPIDFCLLNYGGLRTSIPEGPVTRGRIFELMPFENEIVVITLSPERTRELFQYLAESQVGMPVSGIRLGIKDNEPEIIQIQGEPLDPDRSYKVVTSDYLAGGGDRMDFFLQPQKSELIGLRIRDAIIQHLEKQHERGKKITSQLDGRIYYKD